MFPLALFQSASFPSTTELLWWGLWCGLVVLTLALAVMMRTRWGQSQSLGKCLGLSLLAHLLMAGYATTVHIVHTTFKGPTEAVMRLGDVATDLVQVNDPESEQSADEAATADDAAVEQPMPEVKPWDALAADPKTETPADEPDRAEADDSAAEPDVAADQIADAPDPALPDELPPFEPQPAAGSVAEALGAVQATTPLPTEPAAPIEVPNAERTAEPTVPLTELVEPERPSDLAEPAAVVAPSPTQVIDDEPLAPALTPLLPSNQSLPNSSAAPSLADSSDHPKPNALPAFDAIQQPNATSGTAAPFAEAAIAAAPAGLAGGVTADEMYQQRSKQDRRRLSAAEGGGEETEGAVEAALAWLAKNQGANGLWLASKFGGGRELRVGGEDRQGAGAGADTGVTGLAMLAFLGAGYTHQKGPYQQTVERGLMAIIASQKADGSIPGDANVYAAMYCHGMATLALGEAFGMTRDPRLRNPLRRAIGYTLAAQHTTTGGWRYYPREPRGDTSQLGWQLMVLRSGELAGIAIPVTAREGMVRFLKSVATGTSGGLASYRVDERPTRTMTAEALACRLILGMQPDNPACREAVASVLQEVPGDGQMNLYYWYYATLALHQLQGPEWDRWNSALKSVLLVRQHTDGELAGSWDTNDVWGGYGGRVYTTALATLCLEVYYRFLPLHHRAEDVANRPGQVPPK
ncbi:MAG: squalene--hopene cyclase [Pirellulales bacterium]|nr:squalene--hopene cyclase [Pirellulales bacterium]